MLELELTLEDKMLEGAALGLEVYALLSNHIAGLRELSSCLSLSIKFYLFLTWEAIVPNNDQLTRGWIQKSIFFPVRFIPLQIQIYR